MKEGGRQGPGADSSWLTSRKCFSVRCAERKPKQSALTSALGYENTRSRTLRKLPDLQ